MFRKRPEAVPRCRAGRRMARRAERHLGRSGKGPGPGVGRTGQTARRVGTIEHMFVAPPRRPDADTPGPEGPRPGRRLDRQRDLVALALLAERTRPVSSSQARLLPVAPPLGDLFPDGSLRRGTTIVVSGPGGVTDGRPGSRRQCQPGPGPRGRGVGGRIVVRARRTGRPGCGRRARHRYRPGPTGRGPPPRCGLGRSHRGVDRRYGPGGALPPVPPSPGHGPQAGGPGQGPPVRPGGGTGPGRVARPSRPAPEHRRDALGRCRDRRGIPLPTADDGDRHRPSVGGPPPTPPAVAPVRHRGDGRCRARGGPA